MTQHDFACVVYASVLSIRLHPRNDSADMEETVAEAVKWARRLSVLAFNDYLEMQSCLRSGPLE